MNKVAKRLLTFFIGIPLVLSLVFIEYKNHLALNIAITIFSILGASEFYNMLSKQAKLFPKPLILIFSGLLPVLTIVFNYFNINTLYVIWILIAEIIILFSIEGLFSKTFENSTKKLSFSILILFYCGFMITLLSYIAFIPQYATYYLVLFFIQVFMTDSFAWFFGVLFGKNNRGLFAASPNKSIVGFIGGIFGSIVCSLILKFIFKEIFTFEIWKLIVVSVCTSLASIVGDLIESVFKRSCDCKDSGKLIPGRGGVLDSIDSILVASPVFYAGLHFLLLN